MMRINIAICDDEQKSLQMIQKELYHIADKLKIEIETYAYKEGKKVLDLIYNEKEDFDVLFLDIDMPDVSGLEVAKKLRQKHLDIILIFISAYEQYVFESIEYNPFRYIRKNRIEKELMPCLKAAYQRLEEMQDSYMIVKTGEAEVRVKHSDIMYFETSARKIGIHLKNGEVLCVANAKYIGKYSNHDITLDNGEHLIVSRTRIKSVKIALMNYWGNQV